MELTIVIIVIGGAIALFFIANAFHRRQYWSAPSPPAAPASPDPDLADDEKIGETRAAIERLSRPCWMPVTIEGDADVAASKFSGTPWLREGEEWPACGNCGAPMQLFLQLNGDQLPFGERPFGAGLLQFFYCTSAEPQCEVDCEAWNPHARSTLVRVVEPAGTARPLRHVPVRDAFPPRTIAGWNEMTDYPHPEDLSRSGVEIPDELWDDVTESHAPQEGDKLLGWPAWVQGLEYPNCRQCGEEMRFLFQVASEDNIPYMFGDVGTGHITVCPRHPSELAFAWACS